MKCRPRTKVSTKAFVEWTIDGMVRQDEDLLYFDSAQMVEHN